MSKTKKKKKKKKKDENDDNNNNNSKKLNFDLAAVIVFATIASNFSFKLFFCCKLRELVSPRRGFTNDGSVSKAF